MATNDGGPAFPIFPTNGGHWDGMALRDYMAAKAMNASLSLEDREWYPEFQDLVEDADGPFQYNPDTKTVYRTPTAYSINKAHLRYCEANTWHYRMAREAYRIADAMLSAREATP